MKSAQLSYVKARSLDHAIELLSDRTVDRRLLAGGQSLVPALNLRLVDSVELIDINGIADLNRIEERGDSLRIGAMTRHAELGGSDIVRKYVPLLADATTHIAHFAIRTRGTIGGSIANADPSAELPACAVALDATLIVAGPDGQRRVPAREFFMGLFETALDAGEIIIALEVNKIGKGERQSIAEIVRRSGDYALAGLAAAGDQSAPSLVFYGVGEIPVLAVNTMQALARGNGVESAVAALADDLDPPSDIHGSSRYRQHISGVLLRRLTGANGAEKAA